MTPGEKKLVDIVIALLERIAVALEKIADMLETVLTAADGWGHLLKMILDLGERDEYDPETSPS